MVAASTQAVSRLKKDYAKLMKEPIPYVRAAPVPANILEWHYIITGAPATPYEGGMYHGKLVFPPDFPFKPPSIYMITPSGRFQTNTRLCLSISDFHPDTWNPAWTVGTIVTGLLSFMNDTAPTLGSITSTDTEKKQLARKSKAFNIKDRVFCELFEDVAETIRTEMNAVAAERAAAGLRSPGAGPASEDGDASSRSSLDGDAAAAAAAAAAGARGTLSSIASNLVVIAGVVLLAFAVRYVIMAAQDADPAYAPGGSRYGQGR
ncbi:hypothetical protein PFISCL1PPCAC_5172 [Pristionchus fissidentatus]|uniref:Ubiquitin-conjugating enzyme E2 J2 n=1 Tax=Pristionchus fissidentatus TaxID=1538716 RepID=A0AAV5V7N5_9BILA|nr:hypothetical protein PFISCL1PPCAC_5172 [Pristionchus fissidentatus]